MRGRQWRQGVTIGVLVVVIFWLVYAIWSLGGKAVVAFSTERHTKAEYDALEARRASLQANLDGLNTPRGEDAAIREAFGVAKPGEDVIVVVPPTAPTSTPPTHWWQKVFAWF